MTIADAQIELSRWDDPVIGSYAVSASQIAAYLDGPYRIGPGSEEERISRGLVAGNAVEMVYEPDVRLHHDHVVEAVRASNGRLIGAMTINPLLDLEYSLDELRRLVREEGFKAVKLDPTAHGYLPHRCEDMIGPILEEAAGLGVPVLFQTGNPPFATPVLIAMLAEAHPRATILLCNLGTDQVTYTQEAAYVATMNSNVYLTTTGAPLPRLRQAFSTLGAERLVFGSGFPLHEASSQLATIGALSAQAPVGLSALRADLDLICSGNFLRLFGLQR